MTPGPFGYGVSGVFGGATAGLNWQAGGFVTGIEGDIGYMNLTGAGIIPSSHMGQHQDITLKGGVYGDITGRAGLALGQVLLYGKGGFAFYTGQATQATTVIGYAPTGTSTFTGWTAGVGLEQKLSPTLSWKIEYLHFNLGPQSGYQTALVADPPTPKGYQFYNWTTLVVDTVKVGVNWQFGGS